MHNIYNTASRSFKNRLDALLLVLKSCAGSTCIKPWAELHPDGSVQSLSDALDSQYDGFYAQLPKVEYEACVDGYLIAAEGLQWEDVSASALRNYARRNYAFDDVQKYRKL
jgi:hypothetical protein